ncbi:tRNA (adenosine(37)-N6)-dimethylallyltransferase MiaA [Litchfieldia alkalitelluris]|uniref:tRNA (adenosine(37)-N6)-dimethylallyltransferase MiaA n=1 Tax=Litchfieldia alkalitelluris TaxID=304268 RepID=UPI000996A60C|nr:tRNA (adenosine(37)-N6)-dimethylallyltransferase MiaA [Litchfieldia alkalitelluris]
MEESSDDSLVERISEKVIVLIGPTAVGKTKLSIELAKKLNAEIISGDSMQIYKEMDIGTAKITKAEMEGIPHHLIDIKEPTESYSVADFQVDVRRTIKDIHNRGKVAMIVGGTGLYIQSVIYDYHFTDQASDPDYRVNLEKLIEEEGIEPSFRKLQVIDPESADRIHPNNIRRVIRALEIHHTTGKTMTQYLNEQEKTLIYDVAIIGLTMEREELYNRINQRVDLMVEEGLLDEVERLYNKGIRDCQSIQAIGYKEVYDYLEGNVSLNQAIEILKQNSRRYAKRQLTWFRNKMNVTWFDVTNKPFSNTLDEILKYVAGKL